MDKKRYFIVFYIGSVGHIQATGYMEFTATGGYLIKSEVLKQICADTEGILGVVITNIIELSESDYNDWQPLPSPPKTEQDESK